LSFLGKSRKSQLLRLPLLIAALGIGALLSRHWPTDHEVRIVLGDAAPNVDEVRLRYAEAHAGAPAENIEWLREVTFHYATGHAPRALSHAPRLPNGDYDVELEIGLVTEPSHAGSARRSISLKRAVHLDSGTAQVDVSTAVRDSLAEPKP